MSNKLNLLLAAIAIILVILLVGLLLLKNKQTMPDRTDSPPVTTPAAGRAPSGNSAPSPGSGATITPPGPTRILNQVMVNEEGCEPRTITIPSGQSLRLLNSTVSDLMLTITYEATESATSVPSRGSFNIDNDRPGTLELRFREPGTDRDAFSCTVVMD